MTITITASERSPEGGKGLARDTRLRCALEEVGQPYDVRGVSFSAMKEPAHLALQPFGSIPICEEGDHALFRTGSIIFHIAERHAVLLPDGTNARARVQASVRRATGDECRGTAESLDATEPKRNPIQNGPDHASGSKPNRSRA
jgi:glutathione S-transferase